MTGITGLILTFNEHENIARSLDELKWLDRIIIIDSFSTDDTCTIAARYPNVTILQRAFDTHTQQWNYGLDQVPTPWVLSLDADYIVPPELGAEISGLDPAGEVAGYAADFRYCVFGRALRTTIYPARTVLFRRERSRYEDDGHTQLLRVEGLVRPLEGKIAHDDRKPLSRWLQSQDRYFKIEARHLRGTPNDQLNRQDRLRKKIFFAPWVIFLYLLVARGLIFDGWPGWYYVCQRTIAEALLSLRLLTEREHLEDDPVTLHRPG